MAIQRKPRLKQPSAADAFIQGAPDAQAQPEAPAGQTYQKGVRKGNKRQISLTITPALLEKVDAMAAEMGQSRAAIINMAIYQRVEAGQVGNV